jgi:CRISPR/Cas system CSM-associated protein Csm3 (group 7 of RAMP superfamily)
MSKPRPGVQAGINLIEQRDASDNDVLWKRVERHYHLVRDAIPRLAQYEANLQAMNMKSAAKKKKKENDTAAACVESSTAAAADATATTCTTRDSFNKQELLEIVQWKHSVGKNRAYNLKVSASHAHHAAFALEQWIPQSLMVTHTHTHTVSSCFFFLLFC